MQEKEETDAGNGGDEVERDAAPAEAVTDDPSKDRKVPKKQQDLEMVMPIKWEDWEISVRCSEEERTELTRELVKRMRRDGLKEAVALRADCVLLGYATKDGIAIYDCRAKRASRFSC